MLPLTLLNLLKHSAFVTVLLLALFPLISANDFLPSAHSNRDSQAAGKEEVHYEDTTELHHVFTLPLWLLGAIGLATAAVLVPAVLFVFSRLLRWRRIRQATKDDHFKMNNHSTRIMVATISIENPNYEL